MLEKFCKKWGSPAVGLIIFCLNIIWQFLEKFETLSFSVDALEDFIRQLSWVDTVHVTRTLWLKCWLAKLLYKKLIEGLPF